MTNIDQMSPRTLNSDDWKCSTDKVFRLRLLFHQQAPDRQKTQIFLKKTLAIILPTIAHSANSAKKVQKPQT